jgi:hypothetical protein
VHSESRDATVSALVARANAAAKSAAIGRLSKIYTGAALDRPAEYLSTASAHTWRGTDRPVRDLDHLLGDICSVPRAMASGSRPKGLEMVVKSVDKSVRAKDLGVPVELDSDSYMLDPCLLKECVAAGGSVELRQFDRLCPKWAEVADDMAMVSGADVYLKLFLAGGGWSANGWHNDSTDVLSTTLFGSKRFQISPPSDASVASVDHTIEPGDTVRVPRGWAHCVTPTGQISALASSGLVRCADWAERGEQPRHLGINGFPISPLAYRLSLRPHVPPSVWVAPEDQDIVRSRIIGGIFLNGRDDGSVTISANGASFVLRPDAFHLLLTVHAAGTTAIGSVCRSAGGDETRTLTILRSMCDSGLVGISAN